MGQGLDTEERRHALAQYGFACDCALCEQEQQFASCTLAEPSDVDEEATVESDEDVEVVLVEEPERSYGDLDYWRKRYDSDGKDRRKRKRPDDDATDEWLLSYVELRELVQRALAASGPVARVLDLGCGTSRFLAVNAQPTCFEHTIPRVHTQFSRKPCKPFARKLHVHTYRIFVLMAIVVSWLVLTLRVSSWLRHVV